MQIHHSGRNFKKLLVIATLMYSALVTGCSDNKIKPTGIACLSSNNDKLVETMVDVCDFHYAVANNDYKSAMCTYNGKIREERAHLKQK